MSKKEKFVLTKDLVSVDDNAAEASPILSTPLAADPPLSNFKMHSPRKVTVTIALDPAYRTKIKTWCAKNNITLAEAFKISFDNLMVQK